MNRGGVRVAHVGALVAVIVIIATAVLFIKGRQGEPQATPSPTATLTSKPYEPIVRQTIALIEAYLLLEPTDTPADRQSRVAALGYPPEALSELTYDVVQPTCGEGDPLTEKAVLSADDVTIIPPDDQNPYLYAVAEFELAQFTSDGQKYPGTPDCPSSITITMTTIWEDSGQEQTLLTVTSPMAAHHE